MSDPSSARVSRRQLLAAGAAAGAALATDTVAAVRWSAASPPAHRTEFTAQGDGPGWGAGWRSIGVANLRREAGLAVLEAGSDVFPNDPRPVAFAVDQRTRDAAISATIVHPGSAPGLVLRRVSPRRYYAAILDTLAGALRILLREDSGLHELASTSAPAVEPPFTLTLEATGARPTTLRAELVDAGGRMIDVAALDRTAALQAPGDPGVLASARTLFPSEPNPVLPALGNLHLLPWSVQEGQAVMQTALGQVVIDEIRRLSTAAFARIAISSPERSRRTRPSVVAAFTGPPVDGGARLHVASDVAARAAFELSTSARFDDSRLVPAGNTNRFHSATRTVTGLPRGRRIYWRPVLERRGQKVTGPVRSFRNGVRDGGGRPLRIAVAACASQFGPIFERLAERAPDVFVWQGDLNYPDTHGPLAQTTSAYGGIWRDFLANPKLLATLERCAFAPQRDDHDYGVQDANSETIPGYPWAIAPWEALVNRRAFYRFRAGAAEVWILDQRRFKSDPTLPDAPDKTLLGRRQRRWLLRTLTASSAPFKIVCSPMTVFMAANARDGNWAVGYETEREQVLDHIRDRVAGTTIFLTGDTHLTGVYDAGGNFEARAAPLGIPKPNDITLVDPFAAASLGHRDGVAYADDRCHFTLLDISGRGRGATLNLSLVREDGATPYERRFEAS